MAASKEKKIKKLLIANRGEIACRIIQACQAQGIQTVAVYSDADAKARHVRMADESVRLGPGPAAESYLKANSIIEVALEKGADAIHPGYGFLSERSEFARAVVKAGLIWVGPSDTVIDLLGNKVASKKAADAAKVPTSPWSVIEENINQTKLEKIGKTVGFPLLLKAAAGGGGRGMRVVQKSEELPEMLQAASREAQSFFGSGEVFMEAFLSASRHVEVQVLGDLHGNVIALGERDCTAQRRHQKVIEECPAPNLAESTRQKLHQSAVQLAKSVGYANAGTVEFMVDAKENIFFLEMNTRLQVEHPVTEMVWGVDLVNAQLRVAQGESLDSIFDKQNLSPRGHAIEVRLYAEDPTKNFMPCPGKILGFRWEAFPNLRVDFGFETNDEISIFYDAMVAKVICWGTDREQARKQLVHALKKTQLLGIAHNANFLIDILNHKDFAKFNIDTKWIERTLLPWNGIVRHEGEVESSGAVSSAANLIYGQSVAPSPWLYFSDGKTGKEVRARLGGTRKRSDVSHQTNQPIVSEYPGKVLAVKIAPGQKVKPGDVLVVCESMKMEFNYAAKDEAVVKSVHAKVGDVIPAGQILVEWQS